MDPMRMNSRRFRNPWVRFPAFLRAPMSGASSGFEESRLQRFLLTVHTEVFTMCRYAAYAPRRVEPEHCGGSVMKQPLSVTSTRLFRNGNSQAVRIPKAARFRKCRYRGRDRTPGRRADRAGPRSSGSLVWGPHSASSRLIFGSSSVSNRIRTSATGHRRAPMRVDDTGPGIHEIHARHQHLHLCDSRRKRTPGSTGLDRCETGDLVMSAVTLGELEVGFAKSASPDLARSDAAAVLCAVGVMAFDEDAARAFGRIQAAAPSRRGAYDRQIAAHAISLGVALVTNNEKDFDGIPEVVVENWTLPSAP